VSSRRGTSRAVQLGPTCQQRSRGLNLPLLRCPGRPLIVQIYVDLGRMALRPCGRGSGLAQGSLHFVDFEGELDAFKDLCEGGSMQIERIESGNL
jgi:hypothetical protein